MSQKIRTLVADDEPIARARVVSLLRAETDIELVRECATGAEARAAIEQGDLDLLFLDIQMPEVTGIDLARTIQTHGEPAVVFVTAYDQYAVAAFEQGAIDYVMKPFNIARLASAVTRLKERLDATPADLDGLLRALAEAAPKRPRLRWINASQGQTVRLITAEEVCYFKADSKYTLVVTADGEALIRKSIKELIDELDPELFWPIHRGVVVNANAISALHRKLNGQLEVRLKARAETLPVSDAYAYRFRQM
jgi:DNA-binding LytR/AlgR family response regulator